MNYRYLGDSGLEVSTVCLGTMTFGQKEWGCNKAVSSEILNIYKERGGNFIDTADKYADTMSEQIIGEWLTTQARNEVIVATKCYFKTPDNINSRGLSRKHIIKACEASLRRLKTEYIDLYQAHAPDYDTPTEETMSAFDTLVKQGKVRYLGCCNYPAWKLMQASSISQYNGLSRFISGQYLYNLLKRDIEIEVMPACEDGGIKVICWSPLSGGMLTAKYTNSEKPPKDTRLMSRSDLSSGRYKQWYRKSQNLVTKISKIAARHNVTPAIVSLAWLLKNANVASVIVGARKPEQIEENCKASDFEIDKEEWKSLDQLSKISYGYPREWCETIGQK